ncbi:multidrug transporter [Corynebacterium sp. HMSC063G05]|nr:multidrug transporter [Corynebacterium sp. HMSC063G05]OFM51148.1 multidrug transporter [Corynebacterium sp. HMSC064H12]OFN35725.1 multidrug transporter [Corynebacterium sp. HMSC077G07]OFO27181.1 multidrug transporter [Corynebacterium sp. HMSC064E07]OFQ03458.1 multidrug transporter [Corynebacterium sp. HMSC070B05]OHR26436.1 multidrug transporter [Corynebacterium sp. HMSC072B09]OHR29950.1 multidrug transporter [Corynebacterium sp. HMSC073B01]
MAIANEDQIAEFGASPQRWWGLLVLAVGLGMIVLDGTIVGVSLPTIISELGLDIVGAQWITTIYSVVFAALLLTSGRAGDRFGRRTLFLVGLVIFTVGSVVAALSTALAPLVIARVIQGIGGACILPSTLSSVNALFRDKDRATAFGIWGAVMSGAAAVGPLLGGVLTQFAGWEAIFWVNVPIAVVLFVLALRWVPNTAGDTNGAGRFDVLGLVLSGIGFGAVVFGIIQGAKIGFAFPSAPVVTLLVGAVVLVAFVLWENSRRKNADPALLDVSMFSYATFSWGNTTAMLVAVGEFALVFVLPLYLVSAIGLSTIATGLVLAAMALGAFFAGAMARHLAARITPAGVVIVGLGLEVFGSLQLAAEERVDLPLWLVVFALIVYGLGLGLASAQLTSLVLGDIPVRLSGQASATQSTIRQIGSALGAALGGMALTIGLDREIAKLSPGLEQMGQGLKDSAGSMLIGLRAQGAPDGVLVPLTNAFAHATQFALYSAVGALTIGFLCSLKVLQLRRQAEKSN